MSISEKIFSLEQKEFYFSEIMSVKKTVIPPTNFICTRDTVTYDRFFYVVDGTITFNDEKHKNLRFSAGDIIYLSKEMTYRSAWETKTEGRFISLNFSIKDSNNNNITFADDIAFCCNDKSGKLYSKFALFYESWEKCSKGSKLTLFSQLVGIMRDIAIANQKTEANAVDRNMLKAIFFLENNYLSEVDIEALTTIAHLKECQFRRKFKQLKGMSIVKYRNMLRINKAAELLKSGEYNVVEAAMIVGFDDPNYFSRIFKTQMGIGPKQYIHSDIDKE